MWRSGYDKNFKSSYDLKVEKERQEKKEAYERKKKSLFEPFARLPPRVKLPDSAHDLINAYLRPDPNRFFKEALHMNMDGSSVDRAVIRSIHTFNPQPARPGTIIGRIRGRPGVYDGPVQPDPETGIDMNNSILYPETFWAMDSPGYTGNDIRFSQDGLKQVGGPYDGYRLGSVKYGTRENLIGFIVDPGTVAPPMEYSPATRNAGADNLRPASKVPRKDLTLPVPYGVDDWLPTVPPLNGTGLPGVPILFRHGGPIKSVGRSMKKRRYV